MFQSVKSQLKRNRFVYGLYMKAKRMITGELLGMTSKTEQDYLLNYAKNVYSGNGKIVDLGCFLGATTIPLVKGLLENPNITAIDKKVFAYDAFIWYEGMNEAVAGTNLVGKYQKGDSFLDEYKLRLGKYALNVEINAGNLTEKVWNEGQIEFLLVDAMKNLDLTNAIVKNFYSFLVPGESFVMHQDFAHFFASWIHLLHWRFRDYFEFVNEIPESSSVVFRYVKKIPDNLLLKEISFDDFSESEIEDAFNFSLSLVSDEKKKSVIAAKVMAYIHQENFSQAKICFDEAISSFNDLNKDLLMVKTILESGK